MAIGDAVKIEKEVGVIHEAIVHGVVVHLPIHHCDVITRDQDLAPDLVHTTSVYVYVLHGNISKGLSIFALPCFIITDLNFT